jgi:hypothetical protein
MKLKIELSREEVSDIVKNHVLDNVKVDGIESMGVYPRENYGGWIVDIMKSEDVPEKEVEDERQAA